MTNNISRPARGLLPLALGACGLFMPNRAGDALSLMAAVLLARGLSLCAGPALRAAAGGMVRVSRLRGNLLAAIALAILGSAASTALCATVFSAEIGLFYGLAGALIAFAQLCADRMYVSPERNSAAIYDAITALLAATALLIADRSSFLAPILPLGGALAGIFLLAGLKTGNAVKVGFKIFRQVPRAFLGSWLVPAALIAYAHFHGSIAAALAAAALFEALAPAFRRSEAESAGCGAFIGVLAAAACALGLSPVTLACLGAALVGLHLSLRRILACAVMLVMALLPLLASQGIYAAVLCAASLALCVPEFIPILLRAKARRRQKMRRR